MLMSRGTSCAQLRELAARSTFFKRSIIDEVVRTEDLLGHTRRAMLACRSALLDPKTPGYLQPSVVAAAQAMAPFWSKLQWGPAGSVGVGSAIIDELVAASYSTVDLGELVAYLRSQDGQRALRASEARWSIDLVGQHMLDADTGAQWQWPAGRLLQYMGEVGRDVAFLAALDDVTPSAASAVRVLSGRIEERVPEQIAKPIDNMDWDKVVAAFGVRLPRADSDALDAPVMRRYRDVAGRANTALLDVLVGGRDEQANRSPDRIRRVCESVTGSHCSDQLTTKLLTMRADFLSRSVDEMNLFFDRAKEMRETGCVTGASK